MPQTNVLQPSDLVRMELILLDHLQWRTLSPTSFNFLELYSSALGDCNSITMCMASFLTVRS